jgi:ferredoxin-NADP reductase
VIDVVDETEHTRSIVFEVPDWPGHRAGQHVDVRLTAEDGYQAQRSYSIASAPEDTDLVLTVERIDDGEVSPYLAGELRAGDQIELRGPVGGYFVWDEAPSGPVLLIAGGSGIVPFRAMLRHRVASGADVPVRLLYSARAVEEVIYREELMRFGADRGVDVQFTLTRAWPEEWAGHRGRIDRQLLETVSWPATDDQITFVCGPTGLVEATAGTLVQMGNRPDRIKTERFGPSG